MRPSPNASATIPFFILAVVFAYVAIALIPGPRRVATGLEMPILMGVAVLLAGVALSRPHRALYMAGVAAIVLALAIHQSSSNSGFAGWHAVLLFPIGWTLVGSSVWSWRAAVASYVAVGVWALFLTAAPEGIDYFSGPLRDVDQLVFGVLVPIALWPYVTFGMLAVFGIHFS